MPSSFKKCGSSGDLKVLCHKINEGSSNILFIGNMYTKHFILIVSTFILIIGCSCSIKDKNYMKFIFQTGSYTFKVDENHRMSLYDINNKLIDTFKVIPNHFYSPTIGSNIVFFVSHEGNIIEYSLTHRKMSDFLKGLKQITYINYIQSQNALLVIYEHGSSIGLYSIDNKNPLLEISNNDKLCNLPNKNFYSIIVDSTHMFIADWMCKNISVYEIISNKVLWTVNEKLGSSYLIDLEDKIMIATNEYYEGGYIEIRNKSNGVLMFTSEIKVQDRMKPIEKDGFIYIYCYDNQLIRFDKTSYKIDLVKKFENSNEAWDGSQMKLIGNKIIAQNLNFDRVSFDLETKEVTFIEKANRGGFIDVYLDSKGGYHFLEY